MLEALSVFTRKSQRSALDRDGYEVKFAAKYTC